MICVVLCVIPVIRGLSKPRRVKKLKLRKGGSCPTFLDLDGCCTTSLPWTCKFACNNDPLLATRGPPRPAPSEGSFLDAKSGRTWMRFDRWTLEQGQQVASASG